jgi:hypothetical protein
MSVPNSSESVTKSISHRNQLSRLAFKHHVVLIVYTPTAPLACPLLVWHNMRGIGVGWGAAKSNTGQSLHALQRHVSCNVSRGPEQSTIILMVHQLAVGATFAVWTFRVSWIHVKHLDASSKYKCVTSVADHYGSVCLVMCVQEVLSGYFSPTRWLL